MKGFSLLIDKEQPMANRLLVVGRLSVSPVCQAVWLVGRLQPIDQQQQIDSLNFLHSIRWFTAFGGRPDHVSIGTYFLNRLATDQISTATIQWPKKSPTIKEFPRVTPFGCIK